MEQHLKYDILELRGVYPHRDRLVSLGGQVSESPDWETGIPNLPGCRTIEIPAGMKQDPYVGNGVLSHLLSLPQ